MGNVVNLKCRSIHGGSLKIMFTVVHAKNGNNSETELQDKLLLEDSRKFLVQEKMTLTLTNSHLNVIWNLQKRIFGKKF